MTHNSPSRDHARHNRINLVHGSFDCQNIRNDTNVFCVFGRLLSAWAHHKELRRLKSCQYRRTVCWHCEFGKFVGMIISICWQFFIHGQGSFVANVLGLTSRSLHFCKFDQWKKHLDALLCSLVALCETTKITKSDGEGLSCVKYLDFPVMQWGRLVKYSGFNKVFCRIGVFAAWI